MHPLLPKNSDVYSSIKEARALNKTYSIENLPVFLIIFPSSTGYNGRIEYNIIAGDDNNDFYIFPNGTIQTQHILDRETTPIYSLVIIALDCAHEPEKRLSSTVQVGSRY